MKKLVFNVILTTLLLMIGCGQNSITGQENKTSSAPASIVKQENNTSTLASQTKNNSLQSISISQSTNTNKTANNSNKKPEVKSTQVKPNQNSENIFTLIVSKNNGSKVIFKKKINITAKKSALEYLKENADVIDEGGFIKSINGVESIPQAKLTDEQKKSGIIGVDWFIYLNNKKTQTGAADVYPSNGDVLVFDYKEWTFKDMAP